MGDESRGREERRNDRGLAGFTRCLGLFVLLLGFPAAPALAERGALTLEVAGGVSGFRAGAPEIGVDTLSPLLVAARGRISLFTAPGHHLELGLSGVTGSSRQRRVSGVEVQGRQGTYIDRVAVGGLWALLRASGLGLIFRGFVELGLGAQIARRSRRDHLSPGSDGAFVSYGLTLPDTRSFAPAATASLGAIWAGDRLSFGLRAGGDLARIPGHFVVGAQLELFTAWSLYP